MVILPGMSESIQMKKPDTLIKVDQNNCGELIWWSIHFGITPENILSIINKVGNSTEDIRKYLQLCKKSS